MKLLSPSLVKFKNWAIAYALAVSPIFLFNLGGVYNDQIEQILYLPSLLVGVLAIWSVVKVFGYGSSQEKPFLFIFYGSLMAAVGQTLWDVLHLLSETKFINIVPTVFFFMAYIFVFIGYVYESRVLKVDWKPNHQIYLGILAAALGMGAVVYKIKLNPETLRAVVNLGYAFGDILLIVVSAVILQIVIAYKGGLLEKAWTYIFTGHFLILTADVLLIIFGDLTLTPFGLIKIIWLSANLFVAVGFYSITDAVYKAQRKIESMGKR